MPIAASAPGKVVLLGEYAVLDGAEALVMACTTRCTATIATNGGGACELTTLMPQPERHRFEPSAPSGASLVDTVRRHFPAPNSQIPWRGTVDSSAFFAGPLKLGLGSSAAALVAFAGAWQRLREAPAPPELSQLIQCHRDFQRGSGSGIDVAAAWAGGTLNFRLDHDKNALIGSVQLPKSVGFAGIFAGGSASTPDLVGQYRQWVESGSARAAALKDRMFAVTSDGRAALSDSDDAGFVAAIDEYGRCLATLGREIGMDLVTRSHQRIGRLAGEFGLAYKVSGAGGGDIGIACGLDRDALNDFSTKAAQQGMYVVPLAVDEKGLRVEEYAG